MASESLAQNILSGLRPVDRILVHKSQRRLALMRGEAELLTCRVALGRAYGAKLREGDGRTPEGQYHVSGFNPRSEFYRAVRISYPNEEDRRRAAAAGVRPGGQIMIHGLDPTIEAKWRERHWMFNWTNGCVAVTDTEMDLIWASVDLGTPVTILP